MVVLLHVPVVISALLIGSHFLRAGNLAFAVLSLMALLLLFVKAQWAARVIQTGLVLAALEWVRTIVYLVLARMANGQPWMRMVIILGAVAFFTGCSALVFRNARLRKRFKLT